MADSDRPNGSEQVELLRGIWNEIKALGQTLGGRIDQTNARLDAVRSELKEEIGQTNQRLDQTNERLDMMRGEIVRHIAESEVRTATAITSLGVTLCDVRDLLRERADLRNRMERCEQDIKDIRSCLASGPR